MGRSLITERDVLEAARKGASVLTFEPGTIVTPSARDAARQLKVELSETTTQAKPHTVEAVNVIPPTDLKSANASVVIALGADHGGYGMKEAIKSYLSQLGYTVLDVGTNSDGPCDYPDFAFAVATLVASNKAAKGIMIDSVGVASAIVANKVPGIRAVPCYTEFVARSSREHNDANVLTLGGKVIGIELAKAITKVWLETWFGGGRHQGRVRKISEIEGRFAKRDDA